MLWDKLKEYKEGRIIILTTHFMDEADYLGDRIGIMGDGRIKTCGTSMFLKKRFGVGYTLDIFTKGKDESNNNKITQLV
jgi:ATP-binding cassette subfamily A (ABC1) protein 3